MKIRQKHIGQQYKFEDIHKILQENFELGFNTQIANKYKPSLFCLHYGVQLFQQHHLKKTKEYGHYLTYIYQTFYLQGQKFKYRDTPTYFKILHCTD